MDPPPHDSLVLPLTPALLLTPSTPNSMDGSDDGWRSPLPTSFLPPEETKGEEFTVGEGRKEGRRRAPTLQELSAVLRCVLLSPGMLLEPSSGLLNRSIFLWGGTRLQHPEKFDHLPPAPLLPLAAPNSAPPTSTAGGDSTTTAAAKPTRSRLSASISSATLSHSQSSPSSSFAPSLAGGRRAFVADVPHHRSSALPTLAALGERFRAKEAAASRSAGPEVVEEGPTTPPLLDPPSVALVSIPSPPAVATTTTTPGTHPLQHEWTFYFLNPRTKPEPTLSASPSSASTSSSSPQATDSPTGSAYEGSLRVIGVARRPSRVSVGSSTGSSDRVSWNSWTAFKSSRCRFRFRVLTVGRR